MARAAFFQSEIVLQNILALIKGKNVALEKYVPNFPMEGSIKLTLGKVSLERKLVIVMLRENMLTENDTDTVCYVRQT